MDRFLDVHTHHYSTNPDVESVLCLEPSQFLKGMASNCPHVSVGHHPWRVGLHSGAELATMAQILQDKQIVSVGEMGLDKLCETDFIQQQELFKAQLRMAACVQKPVIVHCVKAWDELLVSLAQINNLPPVIVHGFRGKPQLAQQLVRRGLFLSFGSHFNPETVRSLPNNTFFLETDDDVDADIVELYEHVASIRQVSIELLNQSIRSLWNSLQIQDYPLF